LRKMKVYGEGLSDSPTPNLMYNMGSAHFDQSTEIYAIFLTYWNHGGGSGAGRSVCPPHFDDMLLAVLKYMRYS